ncbi:hypothetical protein, partial [Burkholderia pseudomallei]
HLEFVLRGHGRLQHHAIKKQKPRTWRGFVSNLTGAFAPVFVCARDFTIRKKLLRRKKSCCVAQPSPLQHGKPHSAIRNIDVNLLILME